MDIVTVVLCSLRVAEKVDRDKARRKAFALHQDEADSPAWTRVADSLADALARARENALMARKHALNARKHAMWLATNAKKHATNVGLHAMAAGRTIATSLTVLSAEDHAALRAQARRHHKMHWKRRTFFLRHGPRGAELR